MPKFVNPNPASPAMMKYAKDLLRKRGVKYITDGDMRLTVTAFLKTQSWDEVSAYITNLTRKPIDIFAPRPAPVQQAQRPSTGMVEEV